MTLSTKLFLINFRKYVILGLLIIGMLTMVTLTLISFSDLGKLLFVSESADYLTSTTKIDYTLLVIFLGTYACTLISFWIKPKFYKLGIISILFLLWLLCGRMIGFNSFSDGRVNTGWYYLEYERIYLCNSKSDCESLLAYGTKMEILSLWRIKITNENINEVIFVGPFTWKSTLEMLHSKIGFYKVRK